MTEELFEVNSCWKKESHSSLGVATGKLAIRQWMAGTTPTHIWSVLVGLYIFLRRGRYFIGMKMCHWYLGELGRKLGVDMMIVFIKYEILKTQLKIKQNKINELFYYFKSGAVCLLSW